MDFLTAGNLTGGQYLPRWLRTEALAQNAPLLVGKIHFRNGVQAVKPPTTKSRPSRLGLRGAPTPGAANEPPEARIFVT